LKKWIHLQKNETLISNLAQICFLIANYLTENTENQKGYELVQVQKVDHSLATRQDTRPMDSTGARKIS